MFLQYLKFTHVEVANLLAMMATAYRQFMYVTKRLTAMTAQMNMIAQVCLHTCCHTLLLTFLCALAAHVSLC